MLVRPYCVLSLLDSNTGKLQRKSVPKSPGVPCSCANRVDYGRRAGRVSFRWAAWCRGCGSPALVEKDKMKSSTQLWSQRTDPEGTIDFVHAPILWARSAQWLMWGKRSISFHFQLRPLIPPSAGGPEGVAAVELKTLCWHACSKTLLHKSDMAACTAQPVKFFFFFLHNSTLHYSEWAIYS